MPCSTSSRRDRRPVHGLGAAGAVSADVRADVHPAPAVILQVVKAFDNPEGAIFSADGNFLFVSNAAEIGDRSETFGWTEGEGYVSKLEVLPSGELAWSRRS